MERVDRGFANAVECTKGDRLRFRAPSDPKEIGTATSLSAWDHVLQPEGGLWIGFQSGTPTTFAATE